MAKNYKIIILFFFSFFCFLPFFAHAANLTLSPSSGTFEVGDKVTVKVIVSSAGTPFNAVSGSLSFPTSIFSVDSVSKANSVLNFWVTEPTISSGIVKFEGIALGGTGSASGTVVTVNMHALASGTGTASFISGQILANDGQGTDITGNLTGGTYSVKEATVKPAPSKVVPSPAPVSTPEPTPAEGVPQPKPTLTAPEIVLGTKYGAQAIIGTSDYPLAQALVTFVAPDGVKIFILGSADADGSFSLLVPHSLRHGVYSVSAVMIKDDKTNSQTSDPILVQVGSIVSDIDNSTWIVIALLLLMILYLLLRTHTHFKKKSRIKASTAQDLNKVSNLVHKSFDILREDVIDYDNAKLTATEHKRMSGIKKDISEAEKIITKEIKDIEL